MICYVFVFVIYADPPSFHPAVLSVPLHGTPPPWSSRKLPAHAAASKSAAMLSVDTRVVWICMDRTFMKFHWPQWKWDGLNLSIYRNLFDTWGILAGGPLRCPSMQNWLVATTRTWSSLIPVWLRYQSSEVVKTNQDQEPAATNATRPMVMQAISTSTPSFHSPPFGTEPHNTTHHPTQKSEHFVKHVVALDSWHLLNTEFDLSSSSRFTRLQWADLTTENTRIRTHFNRSKDRDRMRKRRWNARFLPLRLLIQLHSLQLAFFQWRWILPHFQPRKGHGWHELLGFWYLDGSNMDQTWTHHIQVAGCPMMARQATAAADVQRIQRQVHGATWMRWQTLCSRNRWHN